MLLLFFLQCLFCIFHQSLLHSKQPFGTIKCRQSMHLICAAKLQILYCAGSFCAKLVQPARKLRHNTPRGARLMNKGFCSINLPTIEIS